MSIIASIAAECRSHSDARPSRPLNWYLFLSSRPKTAAPVTLNTVKSKRGTPIATTMAIAIEGKSKRASIPANTGRTRKKAARTVLLKPPLDTIEVEPDDEELELTSDDDDDDDEDV